MFKGLSGKIRNRIFEQLVLRGYFRDVWYPTYQFQYFPRQLCFLADCLDKTANVEGAIVEIGCAHGLTTTFLYEYMNESGKKREYYCVDTFSGFTSESIAFEINKRGKHYGYVTQFKNNDVEWFREALSRRQILDLKIIQADICALDVSRLPEKIAFCLLDVDLYQPVRAGLEKTFQRLSPGGMIVVDDCWTKSKYLFVDGIAEAYDGAMQAYKEFTAEHNLPESFVETKLAVINRPLL